MKKRIGILLAVMMSLCLALPALAEGDGILRDVLLPPMELPTEAPTETPTEASTAAPQQDSSAPDAVVIAPASEAENGYKDLLMDTFKQTSLGQNASLRSQISKILYHDAITVTAENYTHIVIAVNKAMKEGKLSDNAALDHYTEEDLRLATELIDTICDELGVDYSIDPSNDSQNEYARVVTITKNGKVLGKINSDAKTDLGETPSIGWIIAGSVLLAAAAAFGIGLVVASSRGKRTA